MAAPAGFTGPVNLGNPAEFTIKALAELVIATTRSRSELAYLPLPQDDPRQRRPDISLAQAQLGWQPGVALAVGLTPTIAYFAARLDIGAADAPDADATAKRRGRRHLRRLAT